MSAEMPPWAVVPESWVELAALDQEPTNTDPSGVFDRWRINSVDEAEWAMQHVAHAAEQIARVEAQRALWQDKLDRWFADSTREPRRTIEFFEGHLERWGAERRRVDPATATLRLPSGDVATTQSSAKIVVTDPDTFCAWALAGGVGGKTWAEIGCVRTKHEPAVKQIRASFHIVDVHEQGGEVVERRVVTEFGENVPGLGVEDEHVTAAVKPRPSMAIDS